MADTTGQTHEHRDVDAPEFALLMTEHENAVVLDVRTEFEHEMERIEGSLLCDISDPAFPERIEALDRNRPYLVYCRSGNRSAHAMMFMQQLGFTRVYNLADGILGWTGPVVEGA